MVCVRGLRTEAAARPKSLPRPATESALEYCGAGQEISSFEKFVARPSTGDVLALTGLCPFQMQYSEDFAPYPSR